MEKSVIQNVCKKIYTQYPMVDGILPEVKPQPNETQLLIFKTSGKVSDQKCIPVQVRVIIDKYGEVIKITASR